MNEKQEIINLFKKNVKGKKADLTGYNGRHDGKEGHWLERQMGIRPNSKNEADLFGYEMKKDTAIKTTFGDWSPDFAIWKSKTPSQVSHNKRASQLLKYFGWKSKTINTNLPRINRDAQFLKYFGKPNHTKNGRLSWSGEPAPKVKGYNKFGQILCVDKELNILACYSFSKDTRKDKTTLLPTQFQYDDIILAKWMKSSLKEKLERKFNDKGWFKCYKNNAGIYTSIGFGDPISYDVWINLVKKGVVFYDSGMYAGNSRPYAQWRADNNFWDSLVTDQH